MHPTYTSDKAGKCPICGMDLVLQKATKQSKELSQKSAVVTPEGYAAVSISADKLQLMGVTTIDAKWMDLDQSIELLAASFRMKHAFITSIQNLKVILNRSTSTMSGQFVKKGDPLFSIYSPELLATQREYLIALRAKNEMAGKDETILGIDLLEAARQRLALWDIGPEQLRNWKSHRSQ